MSVDPSVTFVNAARPANGGTGGGAAGGAQIRLGPVGFDGSGAALAGADRPNPRAISNQVFSQLDGSGELIDLPNSGGFSSLLWVWGQFLDHDLDQTNNGSAFGRANIAVPAGDPVFAPGSVLGFSRSEFLSGTGTSAANPRQYKNEITAFLDGSNLYGSSAAKLAALLEPGTAKLRLTAEGTIGFASGDPVFGAGAIAGDTRADENVALLSMHALFAREHNRIVDELAAADPSLGTAALFEGARARVEAILQAITYNEFLPILIGEGAIDRYDGFRSNVNPAISLEFSTAIYRFGHTLLSPTIERMNEDGSTVAQGNLALRDAFQRRGVVEATGIEAILRGMSTTKSQELDTFVVEDVRSLLFGGGGPGTDLAALNIQRGRDHGLPTYNDMRLALGLEAKTSFAAITTDAGIAARLSAAYGGEIAKLDLWVGGLAEDAVGGGMLGETFRAVMIDQFTRLRDGDAFWSEGRGFGAAELAGLWSTSLSDVILRNSDVRDLQDAAFLAYARIAGGPGADVLTAGPGRNLMIGGAGDDRLIEGAQQDHLSGGDGADRLEGRSGVDKQLGGGGDDLVIVRGLADATDSIDGGAGADTIRVDRSGGGLTLAGTGRITGVETFDGAGQSVTGTAGADALDFSIFTTLTDVPSIRGGAGADVIIGGAGADLLMGQTGDDRVFGGAGNDRLAGEAGVDVLDGGAGDDVLFIQKAGDANDSLSGGAGLDTIRVASGSGDVTLAGTGRISGAEVFDGAGRSVLGTGGGDVFDFTIFTTVTGVAAINGGNGNDTITGSAAADRLIGGQGADTLNGAGGNDILTGATGNDRFLFVAAETSGQTTITDFDAAGNDALRLLGYSFGSADPGALSDAARLDAVSAATTFDSGGATIDLAELGGAGEARLTGVTTATLSFGAEDFLFT